LQWRTDLDARPDVWRAASSEVRDFGAQSRFDDFAGNCGRLRRVNVCTKFGNARPGGF
jgi:hypothetical protein